MTQWPKKRFAHNKFRILYALFNLPDRRKEDICFLQQIQGSASLFQKVATHFSVFFLLHLSHSWNFILQIPLFPRKSIVLPKFRRTVRSLKQQMNSCNMFTRTCKKQHKRQKLIKQEKHCSKGKSIAYNCFRLHAPCIFKL